MRSKHTTIIITTIITLALAGCFFSTKNTQESSKTKLYPYDFNSVKITYQMTGSTTGTSIRYIKGDSMAMESHTKNPAQGDGQESNLITIYSGRSMYQIDLDSKTAIAANNPDYDDLMRVPAEKRIAEMVKKNIGSGAQEELKPKGQKTIAEQSCDLYDSNGAGEVCLWKGIPVYVKVDVGSFSAETVATKIEINADIPDSIFMVPADVKITDPRITQ